MKSIEVYTTYDVKGTKFWYMIGTTPSYSTITQVKILEALPQYSGMQEVVVAILSQICLCQCGGQMQRIWGVLSMCAAGELMKRGEALQVINFCSERSACAALRRCYGTKCPLFLGVFFFLSFFLLCHILFSQKGLS